MVDKFIIKINCTSFYSSNVATRKFKIPYMAYICDSFYFYCVELL